MNRPRIVFMGTPAFARRVLQELLDAGFHVVGVVSQPDRPAGRGRRPTAPPVAALARERDIPLMQPERPGQSDALEQLRAWSPDLIVVAAYGRILPSAILSLPTYGSVNVHASLLPRWRGANPIAWAILEGDAETGVSIMRMEEGLDTGPLLAQRAVPIADEDTTASLTEKLAEAGARLLVETLPAWVRGEIQPRPQDEAQATYARPFRKEDGEIDWRRPARRIWRQVRACDPWPGAYTLWQGTRLRILRAAPMDESPPPDEIPGRVVEVAGRPAVVAGEGMLILHQVQLAGKKAVDAVDFARGQRDFIGGRLGES